MTRFIPEALPMEVNFSVVRVVEAAPYGYPHTFALKNTPFGVFFCVIQPIWAEEMGRRTPNSS